MMMLSGGAMLGGLLIMTLRLWGLAPQRTLARQHMLKILMGYGNASIFILTRMDWLSGNPNLFLTPSGVFPEVSVGWVSLLAFTLLMMGFAGYTHGSHMATHKVD